MAMTSNASPHRAIKLAVVMRLLVPLPASAGGPTVPRGTQGVVMDVADLGHEGRAYLVSLGARLDAQRNARPVLRASQFERLHRRRRAG